MKNSNQARVFFFFSFQGFSKFWPEKEVDYDLETFRVRFVEEAVHEGHSTYDFVVSSQHDDYELVS
jgi:hypothetical protein